MIKEMVILFFNIFDIEKSKLLTDFIPSAFSLDRFWLFCRGGVLLSEEKSWRRKLHGNYRGIFSLFNNNVNLSFSCRMMTPLLQLLMDVR